MNFFNKFLDVTPPVNTTPDYNVSVDPKIILIIAGVVFVVGIIILFLMYKANKSESEKNSKEQNTQSLNFNKNVVKDIDSSPESAEEPVKLSGNEAVKSKGHPLMGFIIVLLILVTLIFSIFTIRGCILSQNNTDNSDGKTSITRRSANINDITIDSVLDLSSMGAKYNIYPKVDIEDLEITISFMDKNRAVLTTVEKRLGNVKEGVQVSFTISLFDLGFSVAWNTTYETTTVTGGTVSNFTF